MSKIESVRSYNIGDDVVWQKADSLFGCMQRDATSFLTRGIDAARMDEIAAANTIFKNLPTDPELLGIISTATEIKNATALELRKKIATVRSMAATKYGDNGKYKTFDFGSLADLPDSDLFRTAKRVVRVGTTLLAELASEGLNASMLTEITTLANTFDANLDTLGSAIENRDLETQNRVIAGNNLWALMVKYADVGKSLFEFTDEARYNDYVLTDTTSVGGGTPPAPNQ